ncbi:MAG: hypothetical protein COA45_00915 [Zetaproteobacteria bacterium]|nr:MAG: hypothetical protein COA45_00915 [Zetaproteobacteria bacterium]
MKANLILNHNDEIAFMYGENLGFEPEWTSIDVEQGELFIAATGETGEGKHIKLDSIKQDIYERILPDTRILLVRVKDNDITKPEHTAWVPLMIAQQIL